MARRRDVERAKKLFLAETENRDWMQGVGIGRVESELGLVINVRPGTKAAASRLLNRLEIEVPVSVRAVEEIRARKQGPRSSDDESLAAFREAALSRLGRHTGSHRE